MIRKKTERFNCIFAMGSFGGACKMRIGPLRVHHNHYS